MAAKKRLANEKQREAAQLPPAADAHTGGTALATRDAPALPGAQLTRDSDPLGRAHMRAHEAVAALAQHYELRQGVAVSGRIGLYYSAAARLLRWYALGLAELREDYVQAGPPVAASEPRRFVELAGRVASMLTTGELDMMTLCSDCGAWYDAVCSPTCPNGHDAPASGEAPDDLEVG